MMRKTQFRQINIADVPDAAIDSINDSMNVPKLMRADSQPAATPRQLPANPPRQHDREPSQPAPSPPSESKLTIRVPQALNDAMKRDALDQRSHVRTIILGALHAAGYQLPASAVATVRQHTVIPSRLPTDEAGVIAQAGPSTQQKLSVEMPDALKHALKRRALEQGVSVRILILKALRHIGYVIADADLAPGAGGNC